MGRQWMLVTGVALLIVGSVGLAAVVAAGAAYQVAATPTPPVATPTPAVPTPPSGVSVGERIYVSGVSPTGVITRSGGAIWFQRMGGGCAQCHGLDGKGRVVRMMGEVTDSPDIRYVTLSTIGSAEPSATTGPWSDSQIVRAIREGVEPDGKSLDAGMPRWNLTDSNAQALLDYLKELK